jgi:hypothetical protein
VVEIIILSSEKPGSETIVKEKCLTCGWHRRGHRQCDEGGGLDADVVVIMTIVNYSFGLEAVGDRWVSVLDHIVKKREGKKEGCEVTVPVEKSLGFFLSFFLSLLLLSLGSPSSVGSHPTIRTLSTKLARYGTGTIQRAKVRSKHWTLTIGDGIHPTTAAP